MTKFIGEIFLRPVQASSYRVLASSVRVQSDLLLNVRCVASFQAELIICLVGSGCHLVRLYDLLTYRIFNDVTRHSATTEH
jgi:hypothetical protein